MRGIAPEFLPRAADHLDGQDGFDTCVGTSRDGIYCEAIRRRGDQNWTLCSVQGHDHTEVYTEDA